MKMTDSIMQSFMPAAALTALFSLLPATALHAATNAIAARVPHEMLLLDLYGALRPLDEITGATTTDDILNLIFGTFCIGK